MRKRDGHGRYGTGGMDNRTCNGFCAVDRHIEKQSEYGVSFCGAGGYRRRFDLWDESVFFVTKSGFYYCAESAYGFDMRILRNSGGFTAFLYSNFEYDIEISQN